MVGILGMTELRKNILFDRYGHESEFNLSQELRTADALRLVGAEFHGTTVDANFWAETVSGAAAAIAQIEHDVTLSSGTGNDGYAHLESVQRARFVFAHPMLYRGAIRITDDTVAGNDRLWGAFNVSGSAPQNGFFFALDETGALSINSAVGGSVTSVASANWNGSITAYTVDADLHAYEIHYLILSVEFYIDHVLVHTVTAGAANISGEFDLPIGALSRNSASGVASADLDVHASIILRSGRLSTSPVHLHHPVGTTAATIAKRGLGALHRIIVAAVTNNARVIIYDNIAASGTIIFDSGAMGAQTQPFFIEIGAVPFFIGLTFSVSGANCSLTLVYE